VVGGTDVVGAVVTVAEVVGGRVVVVTGVNVWVGSGFMASLTPKTRLMTAAAITGAVTTMLLVSDASAIFNLQKNP